jgi:invasion protein IalB
LSSHSSRRCRATGGPVLACLALTLLLGLAAALPARGQILEGGTVKAQHGDWQVVCRPPPPGARNEICGAVQSVTAEDNQNVGLTAIVQKHSDGKTTMRVVAPLGVFLGKALGVQIDTRHEGHVPFDRCLAVGCQAQLLLDAPLTAKLKAGKTLVFIIYRTQEVGVGIPISLVGFDQALAALR